MSVVVDSAAVTNIGKRKRIPKKSETEQKLKEAQLKAEKAKEAELQKRKDAETPAQLETEKTEKTKEAELRKRKDPKVQLEKEDALLELERFARFREFQKERLDSVKAQIEAKRREQEQFVGQIYHSPQPIRSCNSCDLPIAIYGTFFPCGHSQCADCIK